MSNDLLFKFWDPLLSLERLKIQALNFAHGLKERDRVQYKICETRNTFCGTWYLPHSHFYNERTVPIIMAGCMAHEPEGYISTSGPKSDVTVVLQDPDIHFWSKI